MSDNTRIEWADATINAVNGCSVISPGCTNCYAMAAGGRNLPGHPSTGLTRTVNGKHVWTGEARLSETALLQPLKWKRPRRIFWNAHGDLFHEKVPDEWIDRVFAVCALTPQHTHMILTKRSARMREYLNEEGAGDWSRIDAIWHQISRLAKASAPLDPEREIRLPLPNVWLGVSVEDQTRADERIPDLLATPAAVRFISAEPLLGPVDLTAIEVNCGDGEMDAINPINISAEWHDWCEGDGRPDADDDPEVLAGFVEQYGRVPDGRPIHPTLDWVICGGESGQNARPMHPDWARSLRDQCAAAGVPFFFKQWGEWVPQSGAIDGWSIPEDSEVSRYAHRDWEGDHWGADYNPAWCDDVEDDTVARVGKKHAGRLLDGVLHDEFPA